MLVTGVIKSLRLGESRHALGLDQAQIFPLLRHTIPSFTRTCVAGLLPVCGAGRLDVFNIFARTAPFPLSPSGRSPDSTGRGTLANRTRYRKGPGRKFRRD